MKPTLLIASPQMKDPNFERALVLVWEHNEEGAVGVVVNRTVGHTLPDVLAIAETMDLSDYDDNQVGWGGPVESSSGTVVTRGRVTDDEGWAIEGGLAVTRSQDALVRLLKEKAEILLCLGYAGWGPGQLDRELEAGGWLYTDPSVELVFGEPVETRYERALATLGLTPNSVWMTPISD